MANDPLTPEDFSGIPTLDKIPPLRFTAPAAPAETPGALDYLGEAGRQIINTPEAVIAGSIRAIQGQSGVEAPGQGDAFEEYARGVARDQQAHQQEVAQRFPESTGMQALSRLSQQLGFSAPATIAGLGAGIAAAETGPGAFIAGGAASGAAAYRTSSAEIMNSYIEALDEEMRSTQNRGLTPQETEAAKAEFSSKATEYGLWEAVPEAIGGAIAGRLIFGPLRRVAGERIARSMLGKLGAVAGVYGEELATEAVTEVGQDKTLEGTRLQQGTPLEWTPAGVAEALTRVAPDTLLMTTVLGGGVKGGQRLVTNRRMANFLKSVNLPKEQVTRDVRERARTFMAQLANGENLDWTTEETLSYLTTGDPTTLGLVNAEETAADAARAAEQEANTAAATAAYGADVATEADVLLRALEKDIQRREAYADLQMKTDEQRIGREAATAQRQAAQAEIDSLASQQAEQIQQMHARPQLPAPSDFQVTSEGQVIPPGAQAEPMVPPVQRVQTPSGGLAPVAGESGQSTTDPEVIKAARERLLRPGRTAEQKALLARIEKAAAEQNQTIVSSTEWVDLMAQASNTDLEQVVAESDAVINDRKSKLNDRATALYRKEAAQAVMQARADVAETGDIGNFPPAGVPRFSTGGINAAEGGQVGSDVQGEREGATAQVQADGQAGGVAPEVGRGGAGAGARDRAQQAAVEGIEVTTKPTTAEADAVEAMMTALGKTVVWFKGGKINNTEAIQGFYQSGDTVYVNAARIENSQSFVVSHELVHWFKTNDSQGYAQLVDIAGKVNPVKRAAFAKKYAKLAETNAELAEEELTADLIADIIGSQQELAKFGKKIEKGRFATFLDVAVNVLDTIIAAIDPQTRAYREAVKTRSRVRAVFERAAGTKGTAARQPAGSVRLAPLPKTFAEFQEFSKDNPNAPKTEQEWQILMDRHRADAARIRAEGGADVQSRIEENSRQYNLREAADGFPAELRMSAGKLSTNIEVELEQLGLSRTEINQLPSTFALPKPWAAWTAKDKLNYVRNFNKAKVNYDRFHRATAIDPRIRVEVTKELRNGPLSNARRAIEDTRLFVGEFGYRLRTWAEPLVADYEEGAASNEFVRAYWENFLSDPSTSETVRNAMAELGETDVVPFSRRVALASKAEARIWAEAEKRATENPDAVKYSFGSFVNYTGKAKKDIEQFVELTKTEEGRGIIAQAKLAPAAAKLLRLAPIDTVVSMFKNDPVIGGLLQAYLKRFKTSQSVRHGIVDSTIHTARGLDSKFKTEFNNLAHTSSLYMMAPFDESGQLATIRDQIGWFQKPESEIEKTSTADLIKAAEVEWAKEGFDKKFGKSFQQAFKEVSAMAEELGRKSPQTIKAYRGMTELMGRLRAREYKAAKAQAEELAGVTKLRAEIDAETDPERKQMLEGELGRSKAQAAAILKSAGISWGRIRGSYWPLARFGKYMIAVESKNEEDRDAGIGYVFKQFENPTDQMLEYNRMRAEVGDEFTVRMFTGAEDSSSLSVIPASFRAQIEQQVDGAVAAANSVEGVTEEEAQLRVEQAQRFKDVLAKQWILSRPETAAVRRGQKRKSILGYNEDALRSAMNYVVNTSNRIAYLEEDRFMESLLGEMSEKTKEAGGTDYARREIINSLRARLNQAKVADTTDFHSLLTKVSSTWLMSSPSAALVQMSQPFVVALPRLAAEFKSLPAAFSALNKGALKAFAMKDLDSYFTENSEDYAAVRRAFNIAVGELSEDGVELPYSSLSEPERINKALEYLKQQAAKHKADLSQMKQGFLTMLAVHRGLLSITQFNEALNIKTGRTATGLSDLALGFMKYGEEKSRLTTFYAAFDLAKARGDSFVEAFNTAEEITRNTMFDFSKEGKGALLQKALPRTLLQFQYFRVNMLAKYADVFLKATRSLNAEERAAARDELKYFVLTTSLAGGLMGGPAVVLVKFVQALLDLVSDEDEPPTDLEAELREASRRTFGNYLGDVANFGLGAVGGAQLSQRIGVADTFMVFGGTPYWVEGDQVVDWWATNRLLGPSYSVFTDMVAASSALKDGEYLEAAVKGSPKGVKDFFKAVKVVKEGGVRGADGQMLKKMEDFDWAPFDIVLQMAGINPLEYSIPKERSYTAKALTKEIQARHGILLGRFDDAVRGGSKADIEKAVNAIVAYNNKSPLFAITRSVLSARAKQAVREQEGIPTNMDLRLRAQYEDSELPNVRQ